MIDETSEVVEETSEAIDDRERDSRELCSRYHIIPRLPGENDEDRKTRLLNEYQERAMARFLSKYSLDTSEDSESSEKLTASHDSLEDIEHNSCVKSELAFLSAYYQKARGIIEKKSRRKIQEGKQSECEIDKTEMELQKLFNKHKSKVFDIIEQHYGNDHENNHEMTILVYDQILAMYNNYFEEKPQIYDPC